MDTRCSAPGCAAFGLYVFSCVLVIDGAAKEVSKRACGGHRARGAAWLEKMKAGAQPVDAETAARTAPPARDAAQGNLFG